MNIPSYNILIEEIKNYINIKIFIIFIISI